MSERSRRALEAVRQARITLDRADRNLRAEIIVALLEGATQRELQAACGWSIMKTRNVIAASGVKYQRGGYVGPAQDAS